MPNPNASSPADLQVLTRFREELARATALPGPAVACPALWPRFAGYYQGLTRLPRRLRRALQRRWRRSLGGIALLCALGQAPALAATINVGGACTLVDAITAANNNAPTGGCSAGSGEDTDTITITPPFGGTQTLTTVNNDAYGPTGLPVVTSAITIEGNIRSTIVRDSGAPPFRILAVGATGNLTLRETTVTGGVTSDSCTLLERDRCGGGGIINRGTLTLTNYSYVSGNVSRYTDFEGYDRGRGGGIQNSNGTLTLTNSEVSGNTGGGIYGSGSTLTLTSSEVSGNTGGGIFGSGTLTLTRSGVTNNTGHGMFITFGDGAVSLTNSRVTGNAGDGISSSARGALTVTNSHVSGNGSAGIFSFGTLTLTNSTVSGNTYGGIVSFNTAILTDCTVSGNSTEGSGGGIYNFRGTLTVTNSTIGGNFARSHGGGIYNRPAETDGGTRYASILTLTNSTVSGNTAGMSGGGVDNSDTLTVTNSTVSGNTAADRGGAVDNTGTMTLTNSTLSRNASGGAAGGLFNTGTVTLVQSVLSGNTAAVNGPEAYSAPAASGPSTVVVNGFNIFGHDSTPGIVGFPPLGATDLVPAVPLANVLDPTLRYSGGPTATHALVFGSPAVDVVFGAPCVTATDQRGAPRAQDGDGDTFADCDSGAVERGQVPVQASLNSTRLECRTATCRVPVTCNLTEAGCTNKVEVTVRTRPRRNSDGTVTKAPRLIRFAAGAANIPPGGSGTVTLKLTKQGKRFVRATKKKRLKAVLGIREIATTVSNTPLTISRTDVTIRLKRRK